MSYEYLMRRCNISNRVYPLHMSSWHKFMPIAPPTGFGIWSIFFLCVLTLVTFVKACCALMCPHVVHACCDLMLCMHVAPSCCAWWQVVPAHCACDIWHKSHPITDRQQIVEVFCTCTVLAKPVVHLGGSSPPSSQYKVPWECTRSSLRHSKI